MAFLPLWPVFFFFFCTSLVALTILSEGTFNGFLHPVPLFGATTLIFSAVGTEVLKLSSLEPGYR